MDATRQLREGSASGTSLDDERFMRRAIALTTHCPDVPFGAVIVRRDTGEVVAEGWNQSAANPTWHGEIDAINRLAASGSSAAADGANLVLYTTAEPCPMCMAAILWSDIGTVVFGTSIRYLQQHGWRQIDILADEVARRSPGWSCTVVGGVLEQECNALFRSRGRGVVIAVAVALLIALAPLAGPQTPMAPDPLSGHRWTHRLLIVDVPDTEAGRATLAAFRQALEQDAAGVRDRDLLVVPVGDLPRAGQPLKGAVDLGAAQRAAVRHRFGLQGTTPQLVLIGKDGGEKARQSGAFDVHGVFALIDTMPMRRTEVR